jgi:acyl carrier protein
MEMDTKLQQAFKNGLRLPDNVDYESLKFAITPEWDSVAHLQLIAAIEDQFGILIETNDMLAMNSYPKAKEIVKKYESSIS